jgi:hypothetical protein
MKLESMKLNMFRIEKSKGPLEAFYKQIQDKFPQMSDVSQVLVGPRTYKKLRSLLKKELRRELTYISPKKLEYAVGMNWLNYGPCMLEGVAEGHVVIRDARPKTYVTEVIPSDVLEEGK